ncbi:MAG: hypothetical protein GKR92_08135 [Gammaproteobacteria bacterium]|nr:MAG: hypothetical protein GKR92_08135 [Gammaproteobacteria bacterium]
MSKIKHPYKPNPLTFIFITLFFGGCAAILSKVASSNTQGLILNRFVEFSAINATIFYWCLTAAATIFVVIGLLGIYSALTSKNEIILMETGFSAPKSLIGNTIVAVHYSDITHLAPISVKGQRMLKIEHTNGNIAIQQSALPNKQAYDEVVNTITTKTQSFQG